MCAFVIEKSKGVFPEQWLPLSIRITKPLVREESGLHTWQQPNQPAREFYMSARNGDKSRFNRKRKQKIARRKHTQGLLERVKKALQSADATVRA